MSGGPRTWAPFLPTAAGRFGVLNAALTPEQAEEAKGIIANALKDAGVIAGDLEAVAGDVTTALQNALKGFVL